MHDRREVILNTLREALRQHAISPDGMPDLRRALLAVRKQAADEQLGAAQLLEMLQHAIDELPPVAGAAEAHQRHDERTRIVERCLAAYFGA
jgi:hypothetical protein